MLGGPTMNLFLAILFFALLLVGIGIPTPTTTVAEVGGRACVHGHAGAAAAAVADPDLVREAPECSAADEVSPAVAAGGVAGDRITAIDGQWVEVSAS